MTFQEFLEKWNGKYIDFDGVYGNQCMDLMHQYCVEVLGITDGSVLAAPCAKDVYNTFPTIKGHEQFDQIANTETGVPQEGDIVLWVNGTWGHVAIFIEGDVNSFRSFDQNYPTGSPCHVQNHINYSGVLGWLRQKDGQLTLQKELDNCRLERDRNWNWYTSVTDILNVGINIDVVVAEVKKLVTLEDKFNQEDKLLQEANTKIIELENKLTSISFEHTSLVSDYATLQEKTKDYETKMNEQGKQITSLSSELSDLKKASTDSVSGWSMILQGIQKLLKGGV